LIKPKINFFVMPTLKARIVMIYHSSAALSYSEHLRERHLLAKSGQLPSMFSVINNPVVRIGEYKIATL
tara:strand:+ start:34565 stop:34771 length:207 start_codon:yes stop_codon:yes gene_type:complete